jgi:hypothetical protein
MKTPSARSLGLICSIALIGFDGAVAAERHIHDRPDPQVHGVATLIIEADNEDLRIFAVIACEDIADCDSPEMTEAYRREKAAKILENHERLFAFPEPSACRVRLTEPPSEVFALEAHEHDTQADSSAWYDHRHELDHERSERRSAHTDFIAEYAVDCKDTGGIHGLRVGFFDLMPSIERIVVHYSMDSVTGAAILRPARPFLDLRETQPVL